MSRCSGRKGSGAGARVEPATSGFAGLGHGPGSLSEGYIEGDVVECNFHNGQFNIKTGEVVAPPCMVPIKTYRTVVEDGKVFILI